MQLKPSTPDGRALTVSWGGLPEMFLTHLTVLTTKEPSHWSELTIKDDKLYQYPVAAIKDLRASEKKPSQTFPTPRTHTNLNSTWKLIARARLSYLLIKGVRDSQSFDLL